MITVVGIGEDGLEGLAPAARKVVEAAGVEIGAPVTVAGFVRFLLGEGIEREQSDFAAEVAATAKG